MGRSGTSPRSVPVRPWNWVKRSVIEEVLYSALLIVERHFAGIISVIEDRQTPAEAMAEIDEKEAENPDEELEDDEEPAPEAPSASGTRERGSRGR